MKFIDFSDKDFYKRLIKLALPISFQSFMLSLVAAADAFMLGRLEQSSMTAVSLATQIPFVQTMFLLAITGTVTILGAQYWGKGDKKTVNAVFCLSLRLSIGISLLFFAGCFFFPRQLMCIFTDVPELIELGADYLKIASWSYLIIGISQCYLAIMKVGEKARRSAWISSGAVILNIIFNTIFIFGLFGMPAMGARGAALATVLARIIELVWCLISSYNKGFIHPDFLRFFRRSSLLVRDFFKCSLPMVGAGFLWGIGFTAYTAIMGHMGADAAAANSVTAVVRDLLCCLCHGLATAGELVIAYELGKGNLDTGKLYGQRLSRLSLLLGLATTVASLMLTPLVVNFMVLTDEARSYLVGMLIITSFYITGRCINSILITGLFCAGGDTYFDIYSVAATMWGLALPLMYLGAFVFKWPVLLVFACSCLDEVGKLPWVCLHYKKYKWVRDLTRD